MDDNNFLNNEVSKITGLSPRQVLSWTEKGLVLPDKPAKKAGIMRRYNYKNLLEFGLAKYLIDVDGHQVYSVKKILSEIRDDGDFEVWATNYSQYCLSFSYKIKDKEKEELVGSHQRVRVDDLQGLAGTVGDIPQVEKSKTKKGTLYYIYTDFLSENGKSYIETIRLITPWDLSGTTRAFQYIDIDIEQIMSGRGFAIINLGRIKEEIDRGIDELKK